ncbi:MAG: hypothetical protein DRI73_06155 [Bacteroidetes bacterium]|nr:MAG: hypothetical protein DRI73_06155 [Bacteroidota bacterium]
MKNSRIHIILIVLGITLLGSPTCQDPAPWENTQVQANGEIISDGELVSRAREEIIESIEKEFEATSLDKENLRAFEERSKEKLLDFTDYLTIYSTKKYDESFRNQARKMLLDIYVDKGSSRTNLLSSPDKNKHTLDEFLKEVNNMNYDFIKLNPDNISISDSLKLSENGNYTGEITFSGEILGISDLDTLIIGSGVNKIELIVQRSFKSFGKDSLKVCSVQFGDIQ